MKTNKTTPTKSTEKSAEAKKPAVEKKEKAPQKKEEVKEEVKEDSAKTLSNTTAKKASENVADIEFWGDGDTFKLISKASSKKEGWMKSTKAMEIPEIGCVVQVTTQQGDNVAEAVTYVPGVQINEVFKTVDGEKVVASRSLGKITKKR